MIRFEEKRTEVHCEGDVAVFGCALAEDGTAWVVLGEGEQGEVGRDVPDEVAVQMVKEGKSVVLFGAQDVASFDVLIEVFGAARDRLATASMTKSPAGPPSLPVDFVAAVGEGRAAGAALVLKRAELILTEVHGGASAKSVTSRAAGRAIRALAELLDPEMAAWPDTMRQLADGAPFDE